MQKKEIKSEVVKDEVIKNDFQERAVAAQKEIKEICDKYEVGFTAIFNYETNGIFAEVKIADMKKYD